MYSDVHRHLQDRFQRNQDGKGRGRHITRYHNFNPYFPNIVNVIVIIAKPTQKPVVTRNLLIKYAIFKSNIKITQCLKYKKKWSKRNK